MQRDVRDAVAGIIPACAGSTRQITGVIGQPGDHPRMCGEHEAFGTSASKAQGSSPHVRGALRPHPRGFKSRGIIPACAGSTDGCMPLMLALRDHPRMCGEHPLISIVTVWSLGSSPHVRGALTSLRRSRPEAGIIPACAGSTHVCVAAIGALRDHPRMCGEHDVKPEAIRLNAGSSPHVRGALS